jgi:hypothetical protein
MYFVVLPDGQKFGPADVNLLNQWVAEGRILSNTMLEEAQTGRQYPASSLPGLHVATAAPPPGSFPQPTTMNPPQTYGNYYRGGGMPAAVGDNGQSDLTLAYVFAAIGLVMCLGVGACGGCGLIGIVFPILGLVYANKAEQKGNTGAQGAKILSWVALGLQIAGLLFGLAIVGLGMMS